jgi:hypothetical protein
MFSGDIIHLSIFGQHIVVLSSRAIINELFERRSNIYSDRPIVTMVGELMGVDNVSYSSRGYA